MGPFISRVKIQNFRNFKDIDVALNHKQVIIGENNVGKSNFLRAIQLILDPSLLENDRKLTNSDFHDGIEDAKKNGEVIRITLEIQGYEQNEQLIVMLSDGEISDNPATISITYEFGPVRDEEENILEYQYEIYLGTNPENKFGYKQRKYLNFHVIKALRDVEREMKGLKKSPLYQLVQQFEIDNKELEEIAEELNETAEAIMELDELKEIKKLIGQKFNLLSGTQRNCEIHLSTFDIDPLRLLQALQVLMGNKKRPVSGISLGLCNILYISLMLLLIRDKTIPGIIMALFIYKRWRKYIR